MGNAFSLKPPKEQDQFSDTWSFRNKHVPKHLRPIKPSRKLQRKWEAEKSEVKPDHNEGLPNQRAVTEEKEELRRIFRGLPQARTGPEIDEDNEAIFCKSEAFLGSGPRGAFRWFKGRRYQYQKGQLYPYPNDDAELDRQRVLHYILRWAFEGNVVAPVERQLQIGINVLSVGCGPGMWIGHPVVDMALDYRASKFVAVDVCDLLPSETLSYVDDIPITPFYYRKSNNTSTANNTATSSCECLHHCSAANNHTDFMPIHPSLHTAMQPTAAIQPCSGESAASSPLSTSSRCYHVPSLHSQSDDSPSCSCMSPLDTSSSHSTCTTCRSSVPDTPRPAKQVFGNLDFHILNVTEHRLPFPDNSFDLVVQRLCTVAYTLSDWQHVVSEMIRVTKPGGYIQLMEIDYQTHQLGPQAAVFASQMLDTVRQKCHTEPRVAIELTKFLQQGGLKDVDSRLVSIPLGPWGLDIGTLWQQNYESFIEVMRPFLTNIMGISSAEYEKLWGYILTEIHNGRAFNNIHAAWGRKP
ncbi:uncharacterized protein BYT42DRAFT_568172 [Radiomyces spectabilis]|uniref:uncharacterized protein n=1 Tax=Radiomyces spectabilis TaxID=64574 RepID=UPI00221F8B17|nr:uncharacterized protein BYT42DRAFT_568172 [Radiomyces spectabilis]KAI8379241.1 hypothetical protein BYT42DRAFT_568172 [Radiomyces spectabilis]